MLGIRQTLRSLVRGTMKSMGRDVHPRSCTRIVIRSGSAKTAEECVARTRDGKMHTQPGCADGVASCLETTARIDDIFSTILSQVRIAH